MDDVMANLFSLFCPARRAVLKIFESKYWIEEVKALVKNVVVTNLSLQLCVPQTVPFFDFKLSITGFKGKEISLLGKRQFALF